MTQRRTTFIFQTACLLLLLFLLPVLAAAPQRGARRVVAIGDIHGDLDAFVGILQRAGLIDASKRWSGRDSVLVQTGDFLDRGPKATEVMNLLIRLQQDAQQQNGRVIVLMGNHEAMNLFGDLRYVTENDYAGFADEDRRARKPNEDSSRPAGFIARCEALGPAGKYGRWLRSLPVIARVNDSIFLHGGVRPELASYSVDQLNDAVAAEIRAFDAFREYMAQKKIARPCDTLDQRIGAARAALKTAKGKDAETLKRFLDLDRWLSINENGPLWFRGYADWTDAEGAPQIQMLLGAFAAARFIVGHTPQAGGRITSRFGQKVYLIDTGMYSAYFRGRAAALNIENGKIGFLY